LGAEEFGPHSYIWRFPEAAVAKWWLPVKLRLEERVLSASNFGKGFDRFEPGNARGRFYLRLQMLTSSLRLAWATLSLQQRLLIFQKLADTVSGSTIPPCCVVCI